MAAKHGSPDPTGPPWYIQEKIFVKGKGIAGVLK
jgi:hypothetical protein